MKHYDIKKIAHTIIFFLDKEVKYLGVTKLMKLFFYADKYHLEAYGTAIFKHTYTKLPRGPEPTWLYSIIRTVVSGSRDYDFEEEVDVFNKYINVSEVSNTNASQSVTFTRKKDFDSQFFSKSQLNILIKVATEFKEMSKSEISDKSHDTKAWKSVGENQLITYASMVEDNCVSEYVNFIQSEKNNFSQSFQRAKLESVC